MKKTFLLFTALLLFQSCAYFKKKEPAGGREIVIRYMNLKAVYSFVLNRNKDALDIKRQMDKKIDRLKELDRGLDESVDDRAALLDEYRKTRSELEALRGKNKNYKTKILNQINRAVKNISVKLKADLIFNIGDELIHAKKEYDITEDIMREILRLDERKAPEAR